MFIKETSLVLFIFALIFISRDVKCQLPKTDLYVAEFKNLATIPQVSSVKFLNKFNLNGYNNQAKFFTYNDLYLSSGIDTHQITDIYHLQLKKNEIQRITNTEMISEFSPTLTPHEDFFSVVRIEADRKSQSLWMYPLDLSNTGYRVLSKLNNIGYHTWISKDSVALFLVGSPNTLVVADIKTNKIELITENAGRCIKIDQDGHLIFVHKVRQDLWLLKSYDVKEKSVFSICQMPANREDFDIMPNGTFIASDGAKIKIFNPLKDGEWIEVADFSNQNIMNIQRIQVLRDRVIFINNY
ncbi:MAG: hypothetical protein H7X99_07675 [Saprospiraceae bacterium]|nr:hypothetical protein [Saprospiraceae bacterium]